MTASGYIADRRCPGNPEHGIVLDMRGGGHYCPHHDHDFPTTTKNFWRDDEFEAAKSLPTSTPAPTANRKIKIEKPKRQLTERTGKRR